MQRRAEICQFGNLLAEDAASLIVFATHLFPSSGEK
jgi:hypothetical protein